MNKMDRYTANELTLCDTDKKFPANEVFIVDDVYEEIVEQLPPVTVQQTAEWILTIEDWNKWTCSHCGFIKRTDIHVFLGYDFCPKCGYKMGDVRCE